MTTNPSARVVTHLVEIRATADTREAALAAADELADKVHPQMTAERTVVTVDHTPTGHRFSPGLGHRYRAVVTYRHDKKPHSFTITTGECTQADALDRLDARRAVGKL